MQNQNITLTFGTRDILTSIQRKNLNRRLILLESCDSQGCQLIDLSNQKTVFNNPITYTINKTKPSDNNWQYINYVHFNLDSKEQKIFDSKMNQYVNTSLPNNMKGIASLKLQNNSTQRVMTTTWDNINDYIEWSESFNNFNLNRTPDDYSRTYKKIKRK